MFVVAGHVVIAAPLVFPPALPPAQHGLRAVAARPDCGRGAVSPAAPAGRGRILHHSFGAGYAQRPQGTVMISVAELYLVHFGSGGWGVVKNLLKMFKCLLFIGAGVGAG